jgi:hypothetical protein
MVRLIDGGTQSEWERERERGRERERLEKRTWQRTNSGGLAIAPNDIETRERITYKTIFSDGGESCAEAECRTKMIGFVCVSCVSTLTKICFCLIF